MIEMLTEAVVLDSADLGEQDSRVHLYTKDFGKISAKVKSVKKITSKLAGHLQPLNIVMARILDKNGPQLVDALTLEQGVRVPALIPSLLLVKELTAEGDQDLDVWVMLRDMVRGTIPPNLKSLLSLLGFDPTFSRCGHCGKKEVQAFSSEDTNFYCVYCSAKASHTFYV